MPELEAFLEHRPEWTVCRFDLNHSCGNSYCFVFVFPDESSSAQNSNVEKISCRENTFCCYVNRTKLSTVEILERFHIN